MRVVFDDMTNEERDSFVEGFMSADEYDIVNDWDTDCPYGCPWFWTDSHTFNSDDPYDWGREWFEYNREEIMQAVDDMFEDEENPYD